MRMLILYATKYGQTEKIARRMAETARRETVDVNALSLASARRDLDVPKFDAVVIACPVYYGKFRKPLVRFVKAHLTQLAGAQSALVAVSLAAAFNRDEAEGHVRTFVGESGWLPSTFTCVAGAEAFTRYGFFTGYIMRKIARQQGRGGDFKRDREYTDWEALDQFMRDFMKKVAPVSASAAAAKP